MKIKETKCYSFKELEEQFPKAAERLVQKTRDDAASDTDILMFAANDIKDQLSKVFGPFGRKPGCHFMSWALDGHERGVVCQGIHLDGKRVEQIRAIVAKDPGCIFDCEGLPEPYAPVPNSEEPDGEAYVCVREGGRYNVLRYERGSEYTARDIRWCGDAEAYLGNLHEKILDTLQAEYDYHTSEEAAKTRLTDEGEVFTEEGGRL